MNIIGTLPVNSLLRSRDHIAMQWFATAFFGLIFSISGHAVELLRSQYRFPDGHKLIYRFETQERIVVATTDRDEATRIAIDWATRFYATSALDTADVRSRNAPVGFWLASLTQRSDHQTVYAVVLTDGSIVEPVQDHTEPDEDLITLAVLSTIVPVAPLTVPLFITRIVPLRPEGYNAVYVVPIRVHDRTPGSEGPEFTKVKAVGGSP
jgi:hypothetical protein